MAAAGDDLVDLFRASIAQRRARIEQVAAQRMVQELSTEQSKRLIGPRPAVKASEIPSTAHRAPRTELRRPATSHAGARRVATPRFDTSAVHYNSRALHLGQRVRASRLLAHEQRASVVPSLSCPRPAHDGRATPSVPPPLTHRLSLDAASMGWWTRAAERCLTPQPRAAQSPAPRSPPREARETHAAPPPAPALRGSPSPAASRAPAVRRSAGRPQPRRPSSRARAEQAQAPQLQPPPPPQEEEEARI